MPLHPGKLIAHGLYGWLPGGQSHCVACGHAVWRFLPYRNGSRGLPPLMRALSIIGSDVDRFECPRCGAHDRERHLLLYMHASGILDGLAGSSVVHFAPEKRLSQAISKHRPGSYMRCDLHPAEEGIQRMNIQCMPLEDNSVDLLLANHVLEHVDSPGQALAEIHRVLRPGGHAILQTPYSAKLHATWEDAGVDTPQARLQAFGQEDHVRLFGRDIIERFAAPGFISLVQSHQSLLPGHDAVRHGVNAQEPFFLFRKAG